MELEIQIQMATARDVNNTTWCLPLTAVALGFFLRSILLT